MRSRATVTAITAIAAVAFVTAGCASAIPPPATASGSPGASLGTPATASATAGGPDFGVPLRYRCEETSPPFEIALISSIGLAEFDPDASAGALREFLSRRWPNVPRSGWWLTGRTAERAWFMARHGKGNGAGSGAPSGADKPPELADRPPFVQMVAARAANGWEVLYWEGCRPSVILEDREIGQWVLDPAAPQPGAGSTRFAALVYARECSGGRGPNGRILPPTIVYGEREILVLFTLTPLPGPHDCQGTPPARVVVELREPIGNRQLLDASTYPFRDPRVPL